MRRKLLGRGCVPKLWKAMVSALRDAQWEWKRSEAEGTPQTLAKT